MSAWTFADLSFIPSISHQALPIFPSKYLCNWPSPLPSVGASWLEAVSSHWAAAEVFSGQPCLWRCSPQIHSLHYCQKHPLKMQTRLFNLPEKQLELAAYHLSITHKALPCQPLPRLQHGTQQVQDLFHPNSSTIQSFLCLCAFSPLVPFA